MPSGGMKITIYPDTENCVKGLLCLLYRLRLIRLTYNPEEAVSLLKMQRGKYTLHL